MTLQDLLKRDTEARDAMFRLLKLGPQKPPDDPMIFNRPQKDGSVRPLSEFFEPKKKER